VNIYSRGRAINLRATFYDIDPVTALVIGPADPTTVVFTITNPDGETIGPYTFGVDPNVTHPATGVYICALDPQLPVGIYHYLAQGFGVIEDQGEDDFEVTESAVETPAQPDTPVLGPCYPWINGDDVAACTSFDYGMTPWIFDTVAAEASAALYEIAGRRFPGVCSRTVRPCANSCSCWFGGPVSYGFQPAWWTGSPWAFSAGGWGWYNETGDRFGCDPMSRVRLAGYPVRRVTSVTIDGVDLPEFDPDLGFRNWRLDGWKWLTRMDTPSTGPGTVYQPQFWPGCQNLSLDADQPGTFEITYDWGTDVPFIGKQAATELANQLFLACSGQQCVLPAGVQRVVRESVEIERGLLVNWMDTTKATGLVALDTFLTAYAGGQRAARKSAIWSADQQQFARKLGVTP
jgi:hypothetical protein